MPNGHNQRADTWQSLKPANPVTIITVTNPFFPSAGTEMDFDIEMGVQDEVNADVDSDINTLYTKGSYEFRAPQISVRLKEFKTMELIHAYLQARPHTCL